MKNEFLPSAKSYKELTDRALEAFFLQPGDEALRGFAEAARYSLLAGGKRIRAMLVLEFCRISGGRPEDALDIACGVEMLHAYSLIHDDLPCMDNDDLRRGRPTNHKVYGEALAVLAGDALQPEAFRLIAQAPMMTAENKVQAIRVLADACGADGMVAGQVLDTVYDIRDEAGLREVNRLKTGVMIAAAAELGCIAAKMPPTMRMQAVQYAQYLGWGFQLRDDILDVTGDESTFGKPIGSDQASGKVTYVDLKGVEACQKKVENCSVRAKAAVSGWGDHGFLWQLADQMVSRIK